jgi:hypothetical protein
MKLQRQAVLHRMNFLLQQGLKYRYRLPATTSFLFSQQVAHLQVLKQTISLLG